MYVDFDSSGFALTDGLAQAYLSDPAGEYSGKADVFVSLGTTLPGQAYHDAPPEEAAGFAIIRAVDKRSWTLIEDHRGKVLYSKIDLSQKTVTWLGAIPDDFTTEKPTSEFDEWVNDGWVTNSGKLKDSRIAQAAYRKSSLMAEAGKEIAVLQDAVDLEIATEAEAARLVSLKKYRILLNRLDVSTAPEVQWPEPPAI